MQNNMQFVVLPQNDFQILLNKIEQLHEAINGQFLKKETKLLTTQQVADRLIVSTKTVLTYIELGKLKAVNYNKGTGKRCRYKIDSKDLEVFIKSKRY